MLIGLKHLGVPEHGVVLDVPAGTGRLTRSAPEHGYRVIGADMSQAMLRQGFALHGLHTFQTFRGAITGDIESLPLGDKSVDAVLCLRLMGHLPPQAKDRALREMLRVARVGIVVMFARRTLLLKAKRELLWRSGMRPTADQWYDVSDSEIRALVASVGAEIVACEDLLGPIAESRMYAIRGKAR
jgi:ubiquinone/menaquinone biosynthesis C-methylase UbiE